MYNLGNLKLSSMKLNSYKLPEDLSVASVKEKKKTCNVRYVIDLENNTSITYPVIDKQVQ